MGGKVGILLFRASLFFSSPGCNTSFFIGWQANHVKDALLDFSLRNGIKIKELITKIMMKIMKMRIYLYFHFPPSFDNSLSLTEQMLQHKAHGT